MKKIIITLLLILIIPFAFLFLIEKVGGNFRESSDVVVPKFTIGAQQLIDTAFLDVPKDALRDHHVHIVGLDEREGTSVNSKMLSWWNPINHIKTKVYLSGANIKDISKANGQYVERLVSLIGKVKHPGKYHILAFDHYYNKDGSINKEKSEFYTSNEYVFALSQKYPDIFVPVISVHPYRKDALSALQKWAKKGVKWVKWLPNAHGIDASDEQNEAYYRLMKEYNMVLLTHVGEEQAVEAEEDQALGNPLLFRKPLNMGVKVVMAHCASLGEDEDLDNPGTKQPSFKLFMRMMDNPKYEGLLYGELSAMTQFNRLPTPLLTLLKRKDLHHRLLNGSDYPLPSINMIIHTRSLVKYGMITSLERKYLNEIYSYNPMLFDYVVKRIIRHPETQERFPAAVFVGMEHEIRGE